MTHARCIVHAGPNLVRLERTTVREPLEDEVLVESAYTCVSPGTELRCLAGHEGAADQFPFVPGYALAGRVVRAGRRAGFEEGQAVLLGGTSEATGFQLRWGGHVSHAVQKASKVLPVPEGVSLLDAALARIAAIAYHGVRVARVGRDDRVAVVGLGLIGQCSAKLCQRQGARVVAGDMSASRVAIARAGGVESVVIDGSIAQAFSNAHPDGVDVLVDATGVPAVVPKAVELCKRLPWNDEPLPGARYLVQGSYAGSFTVPYQDAFQKELTFILPRDRQDRDILAVLSFLADRSLCLGDLVSCVASPDDAADVYRSLATPAGPWLTAAFKW